MTDAYSERFDQALLLAASSFRKIHRKGRGAPYITHLLAVTSLVGEHGGDEDQLIAALLHDYIEDIEGGTAADLRARFGDRVSRLVVALSDCQGHPKPPWKERKLHYVAELANEPAEVKLISCADKLHNCRTILVDHTLMGEDLFELFAGKKSGTLWYYRAVFEALSTGWSSPILGLLQSHVEALEQL